MRGDSGKGKGKSHDFSCFAVMAVDKDGCCGSAMIVSVVVSVAILSQFWVRRVQVVLLFMSFAIAIALKLSRVIITFCSAAFQEDFGSGRAAKAATAELAGA